MRAGQRFESARRLSNFQTISRILEIGRPPVLCRGPIDLV
jgi:hypothetical protein